MSFSNSQKYFSFLLLTEFHSHYVVNKFYPQIKSFFLYELSVNDKILIFTKKSTHIIDLNNSPFCLEESREGEPSQNQEAWENGEAC